MSKKNEHPIYPNPQISEVVCEFHFEFNKNKEYYDSLAGEIFTKFQKNFPKMRTIQEVGFGISLEVGKEGFRQNPLHSRQRFIFTNPDEHKYQLQYVQNTFAVNFIADKATKYASWQVFKEKVLEYWSDAQSVIRPKKMTRIGLRYINKIPFSSTKEKPSVWIKKNQYIPSYILNCERNLLSRSEGKIDGKNTLIVTLGNYDSKDSTYGELILDIDRIVHKTIANKDIKNILEKMHDDIWDVFDSGKTDKLEALLNKKK